MTLDEAIRHAEEVADKKKREKQKWDKWLESDHDHRAVAEKVSCELCASEHRQLAEWLKELKVYRENTCGDAISRQAVAEILLKYAHSTEGKAFAEFLVSQINELPSVTPQGETQQRTWRWIPVWERLPEERGVYLVTQKATFPDYVYRRIAGYALNLHDVDEYDFKGKKRPGWYEYDSEWGYRELDDVIAWMPLPEPYKAESEE